MKYIRTDIGIFESEKRNQNPKMFECLWGSVLKEADTIEELCDWFFLEGANGNPINYKKLYTAKRAKERMQIAHDLYGVIHVKGKGLIYVAKMNEKGWLELI